MTKEQMLKCISFLKEVQKEFRFNTNIDTVVTTYESIIKEMEKIH